MAIEGVRKKRAGEAKGSNVDAGVVKRLGFTACSAWSVQGIVGMAAAVESKDKL